MGWGQEGGLDTNPSPPVVPGGDPVHLTLGERRPPKFQNLFTIVVFVFEPHSAVLRAYSWLSAHEFLMVGSGDHWNAKDGTLWGVHPLFAL